MTHLGRLARRVECDPSFVAHALALFGASEGLDDAGLIDCLSCSAENLVMIRLCRMPDADPPAFRKEVEQIASRFGADRVALAHAIRRGQILAELRRETVFNQGTLMAARDADPPEVEEP
jgi:hypothetical protein